MASRFRVVGALLLAAVVTGATVTTGVLLQTPPEPPQPPPAPVATGLDAIDTTTATVRRAAFCGAVPDEAAATATGADAPELSTWVNGDQMTIGSETDVAHEYGCSWKAPDGAVAAGWVFAPPVTPARARELGAAARQVKGCTPLTGAPAYGALSVALSCADGSRTTASYRGLFGDAWLVCEVTAATVPDAAERADAWCAELLAAAGAPTA